MPPEFVHERAQRVYDRLAPKPPPVSPRVTAARRAMQKVSSREARHVVADGFVRQIPPDVDPRAEVELIYGIRDGLDAVEDAQRTEALTQEVTAALQGEPEPEPSGPYRDDAGNVRDPSGAVIDPASEDWWDRLWANDAAKLLGPEWRAGHNPGEE